MSGDVAAWVGVRKGTTFTLVWAGTDRPQSHDWWHIGWLADATVKAIPNRPQPTPQIDCIVNDIRALSHDDYDLLLHEHRARQALGESA